MRTQTEISALLTNPGVIAVVSTRQPEQVLPLCAARVNGGLTALEITFTVSNACLDLSAVNGVGRAGCPHPATESFERHRTAR